MRKGTQKYPEAARTEPEKTSRGIKKTPAIGHRPGQLKKQTHPTRHYASQKNRLSRDSVETCNNVRVGLSPKHGISCQEERLSFRFRVSMTVRPAANKSRTVKKRVKKLFVWSISPSRWVFFRGKNRVAFRKEMNRLPQRRNFFAARQFLRVLEEGKNKASEGFSRSGWSPPACKPRLSFCKPFSSRG